MRAAVRPWAVDTLFVAAILAGSFMLFLIQPMVARMALPRLGGAPAVWNSAMLVYQALLLGGYGYAHAVATLPLRRQAVIHLVLLAIAALWLPIGLARFELPPGAEPALWTPWLLVASIGPLFFAISAQAPLLQRWYVAAAAGRDPYRLYVASNIGSLGGLLLYPLVVEPLLSLKGQSLSWSLGYGFVALLVVAAALCLPRGRPTVMPHDPSRVAYGEMPRGRWLHWVLLALVPSGLMLATTTHLTTDIVAMPLLWVLPLALYLLSFSVAFRESPLLDELIAKLLPVLLLLFGATSVAGNQRFAIANAVIGLALLFVVAVALHHRLHALRPPPAGLTGFYLAMAFGGALGGVLTALVAPILFDWTYEYPLLLIAAAALTPQTYLFGLTARFWARGRRAKTIGIGVAIIAILAAGIVGGGRSDGETLQFAFLGVAVLGIVAAGNRALFLVALTAALLLYGGWQAISVSVAGNRVRSYFGVYTINALPDQTRLAHGTTLHGVQLRGADARLPTTYYAPGSGVAAAMVALPRLYGPHARVGVVGLGTGTLACYAQSGQSWRFYEIDPAIVRLARDSGRFTFLRDCAPNAAIELGDARLRLSQAPDAGLDLLVLDAFSSDSVPMHLMTTQAFATYGRVLAPGGLLLVHVSNRFLRLEPVVAAAAAEQGWTGLRRLNVPDAAAQAREASVSDWIALSRQKDKVETMAGDDPRWRPLLREPGIDAWRDDYGSVLPVLRLDEATTEPQARR